MIKSPVAEDKILITQLLKSYESALNASSTAAVLPLYADSGVFMAQSFPTAVGQDAVRDAYDKTFEYEFYSSPQSMAHSDHQPSRMVTLSVSFDIIEIETLSAKWAFARTASVGTAKVHSTGQITEEGNQELFVMEKVNGEWKIARYCFCTMNPPQ